MSEHMEPWQIEMAETAAQIERAKALLLAAGFKMSVGGCGCCDSPWVRLTHNGENIISAGDGIAREEASFDMFREEAEDAPNSG